MDNETEKHLTLDNLGRTIVTETIKEVEPQLHGSVTFNFKDGFFCNWEINKRGQEQKHN